MEHPSGQEKPYADEFLPSPSRPPGLEFAMGVALFAMMVLAFVTMQGVMLYKGMVKAVPALGEIPFTLAWFNDPLVVEQLEIHQTNGDIVGPMALWSGVVGTALILLTVALWKREYFVSFLGLRLPGVVQTLKWLGIFIGVMVVVELLAHFSPVFATDFMSKVLGSTTDMVTLALGVAIAGPVFEEFLLRGLLFGSILHIADENTAVALTAGVFTLLHLQYSVPVMLLILPMGVVLGYARARSGSIWVPVLLHMLNNAMSVVLP